MKAWHVQDVGTLDSGLNSIVLASNNEMVILPVNEPTFGTPRKSQIQVCSLQPSLVPCSAPASCIGHGCLLLYELACQAACKPAAWVTPSARHAFLSRCTSAFDAFVCLETVQTYLEQNEGAGLQHLALKTDDIFTTMRALKTHSGAGGGFDFMPPASDNYYE